MIPTMLPVSEAKPRINELVRTAEERDVYLARHGRPAAVLIGVNRYNALLEALDDMQDRLSVHEAILSGEVTISAEQVKAELGLASSHSKPKQVRS